jgi:hypothetical protein
VGLAWLARAPVHAVYVTDVLPSMILLGIGAGLSFPSLMTLSMSGATASGLASGLVNTTVQVGGAPGLAVLATLSATRTKDLLAAGDPRASALVGGFHLAWVVSAGIAGVALLVGAVTLQTVTLQTVTHGAAAQPETTTEILEPEAAYSEAA